MHLLRSGKRRIPPLLVISAVILAALAVVSCASLGGASEAEADYLYLEENERAVGGVAEAAEPMPPPAPSASREAGAVVQLQDSVPVAAPDDEEPQESEPAERLRVYSAELELVVAGVEDSRGAIIGIVERAGGYIESSGADFLVVRVPAARFDDTLLEIEETGDVRSRAVRTSDVTDQFFDLQRRLTISEASRERLLELLEDTEDPDERVALLREIRRLTEEIEQLRASLESLDQLIRFSRITVQLISRIEISAVKRQEIPFRWIASLSPLGSPTVPAREDIPVELDDSFAVFESGTTFFAEAADGTQVRAGAVENEPRGNEEFWQTALIHHLSALYRSATPLQSGRYRGVLLESKDREPFFYAVLVTAREDDLIVVELFMPDPAAREARLDGVLEALPGGDR